MRLVQIGDMKYAVYDKRGKVVIITTCKQIAEWYTNNTPQDDGT